MINTRCASNCTCEWCVRGLNSEQIVQRSTVFCDNHDVCGQSHSPLFSTAGMITAQGVWLCNTCAEEALETGQQCETCGERSAYVETSCRDWCMTCAINGKVSRLVDWNDVDELPWYDKYLPPIPDPVPAQNVKQ